jgi:hypothetical protein
MKWFMICPNKTIVICVNCVCARYLSTKYDRAELFDILENEPFRASPQKGVGGAENA